ncbi:MAG TPA: hypothetical protein DD490_14950, partial [Acidobacteria bacterium]|nr:hypothetical protein [Acidobacteriota bacterium]
MNRSLLILLAATLMLAAPVHAQTVYHLPETSEPFPFGRAKALSWPAPSEHLQTTGERAKGAGPRPFTSSRVIVSGTPPFYPLPYSPVGKIFVEWPDDTFSYCSGVVIAPRILLTAGHCVLRPELGASGFPLRLVFAPGYFLRPEVIWEASAFLPSHGWAQGGGVLPSGADFALVELADNNFGRVGDAVGWYPIASRRLFPNHVTILGYPLAYDGGELMHGVASQSFGRGAKGTILYPGDMGAGADGGPLIEKFGVAA